MKNNFGCILDLNQQPHNNILQALKAFFTDLDKDTKYSNSKIP